MNLTLSNRTLVTPPTAARLVSTRYKWLPLNLAEPNLGAPFGTGTFYLSSNSRGERGWTNELRLDDIVATTVTALTATFNVLTVKERLCSFGTNIIDLSSFEPALRVTQRGEGPALLVEDRQNPDFSPFVITSRGNVVIGFSGVPFFSPDEQGVQIISEFPETLEGSDLRNNIQLVRAGSNNAVIRFQKVRGTLFNPLSVEKDDQLGALAFTTWHPLATGSSHTAATIVGGVDTEPTSGYTPGKLIFRTTYDSLLPENRMVIDSLGRVGIGTMLPYELLTVAGNAVVSGFIFANYGDIVSLQVNTLTGSSILATNIKHPSAVSVSRYQNLDLTEAEPSLGVPYTTGTFFLTGNIEGSRGWSKGLPEVNFDVIKAKDITTNRLSAVSAYINDLFVDKLVVNSLTALSATVNVIDINYYELSGFKVTGDVFVDGNITSTKTISGVTVDAVSGFRVNGQAPLNYFLKSNGSYFVPTFVEQPDLPPGVGLSAVNDTNVKLLLSGFPGGALLSAVEINVVWDGVLPLYRGGTNSRTGSITGGETLNFTATGDNNIFLAGRQINLLNDTSFIRLTGDIVYSNVQGLSVITTIVRHPSAVSIDRYNRLSLSDAEPNLGYPASTGIYFLTGDNTGIRGWSRGLPELNLENIRAVNLISQNIWTANLRAVSANMDSVSALSGYFDVIRVNHQGQSSVPPSVIFSLSSNQIIVDNALITSLTAISATFNVIDIRTYEVSGFKVEGDVSITGTLAVSGRTFANGDINANRIFNSNNRERIDIGNDDLIVFENDSHFRNSSNTDFSSITARRLVATDPSVGLIAERVTATTSLSTTTVFTNVVDMSAVRFTNEIRTSTTLVTATDVYIKVIANNETKYIRLYDVT